MVSDAVWHGRGAAARNRYGEGRLIMGAGCVNAQSVMSSASGQEILRAERLGGSRGHRGLRVCAKINSDFAGGDFAFWRGTTKEHSQGSEEKRSQKAKSPQPSGAGRRLAGCGVARRSQPQKGDAPSSRLASGQAALPPKPEVIFAQTLNKLIHKTPKRNFCARASAIHYFGERFQWKLCLP